MQNAEVPSRVGRVLLTQAILGVLLFGCGQESESGSSSPGPSAPASQAYVVTTDGTFMYIAGYDTAEGNTRWRIEKRYLDTMEPDPAFGAGGVVVSNPSAGDDRALGLAVSGSALYVVGYSRTMSGDTQWQIEKRSALDGTLDAGFGTGGVVTVDPSSGDDRPLAVAVDGSSMYVAGYEDPPGVDAEDYQWRVEKRSLATGALVPGFGAGGVVLSNPTPRDDRATAVALDPTWIYVCGFLTTPSGGNQWRIEKRNLATGALDVSFGALGVAHSDASPREDRPSGVALDASSMYIVGYEALPGGPSTDTRWRLEKRSLSTGLLVSSFGIGGRIVSNPTPYDDRALSVALGATGLYCGGTSAAASSFADWRIEKRDASTGSLVPDFGVSGVLVPGLTAPSGSPTPMALDAGALYGVGLPAESTGGAWLVASWTP